MKQTNCFCNERAVIAQIHITDGITKDCFYLQCSKCLCMGSRKMNTLKEATRVWKMLPTK